MCALFCEHDEKWFVEILLSCMEYKEFFGKMVERAEELGLGDGGCGSRK